MFVFIDAPTEQEVEAGGGVPKDVTTLVEVMLWKYSILVCGFASTFCSSCGE